MLRTWCKSAYIAHTIAHDPCRDFVPWWRNLQISGDPKGDMLCWAASCSEEISHCAPPTHTGTHTHTHTQVENRCRVWTEDYLYQQVRRLRPRVAAKPQSEFKLGLSLRVKGKSPASLRRWKGAHMPTQSGTFFWMWHCHGGQREAAVILTSFSEW